MDKSIFNLKPEEQQKALRWQCHRGIKEIEVLLNPFLEEYFVHEDKDTRQAFIMLLEEQDLDLLEWFMRRERPDTSEMEFIVDVILTRLGAQAKD